jgi:hypothetical protein
MRLRASVLKAELGVAALEWNLLRYTQMLRAMTGRTQALAISCTRWTNN